MDTRTSTRPRARVILAAAIAPTDMALTLRQNYCCIGRGRSAIVDRRLNKNHTGFAATNFIGTRNAIPSKRE